MSDGYGVRLEGRVACGLEDGGFGMVLLEVRMEEVNVIQWAFLLKLDIHIVRLALQSYEACFDHEDVNIESVVEVLKWDVLS